jgi:hypothetical protein
VVTLIRRRYPLVTFFVLACRLSWILESPLGTKAPFPQAEKAGGDLDEITEVFVYEAQSEAQPQAQ